jgi:transposase
MTPREANGLVIAATQKLIQKGKVWLVPSQSGKGKYTVHPDSETPFCSCADFEETDEPCKHIFAVRFAMKRDQESDGAATTARELSFGEKKVYRQQDWPIYNFAQAEERKRFLVLLHDLCRGLPNPPENRAGRKRTAMADMVFAVAFKVYTGFSGRRFGTDLDEAASKGYVSRKLHPGMTWTFLESKLLTPVLKSLIEKSSLPLRTVETTFAPDSTGFSTSRHVRWVNEKYGTVKSGRDWVKAHCMAGTKTHIVTAVEILDRNAADSPQFKPLVETTAKNGFAVREVPADKAYLSRDNLDLIDRLGGTAYIPFKSNSVPGEAGSLWERMYHFYAMNREEFLRKYHQRSNAESVFSMAKAKFGDSVRSRTPTAMVNEVLCKLLCHNICCVILSQLELGIEPVFWGEKPGEGNEASAVIDEKPDLMDKTPASRAHWMFAGA